MRLTPGERQSGDGTSLPETPSNLTNVCSNTSVVMDIYLLWLLLDIWLWFLSTPYKLSAVYAELENLYSGKRSKSLKSRPPPAPESLLDLDPPSRTVSPTLQANTGSHMTCLQLTLTLVCECKCRPWVGRTYGLWAKTRVKNSVLVGWRMFGWKYINNIYKFKPFRENVTHLISAAI